MMERVYPPKGGHHRTVRGAHLVFWWCPALAGLLLAAAAASAQSLTYSRGQNVSPAYEGWEIDADGQKYFVFGYMNRNWEEEIDVPIGPENSFNVGEIGRASCRERV